MGFSISTKSGGHIELSLSNNRFYGNQLLLHIDQSSNLKNGDDSCTVPLTNEEVKGIIAMLNDYISYTEGTPFVVLAEPLLGDHIIITVDETKLPPKDS